MAVLVLITTSAPQPPHLKLRRLAASAAMSRAPDAICMPSRSAMPSPSPKASSTRGAAHSWRQYRQISRSDPGRCWTSVAPHLGQWFSPSRNSLAEVSIVAGSGASSSSRIGCGSLLSFSGSSGGCPGAGGMSCGEPGPVGPVCQEGLFGGSGAMRCAGRYRPSALALAAS